MEETGKDELSLCSGSSSDGDDSIRIEYVGLPLHSVGNRGSCTTPEVVGPLESFGSDCKAPTPHIMQPQHSGSDDSFATVSSREESESFFSVLSDFSNKGESSFESLLCERLEDIKSSPMAPSRFRVANGMLPTVKVPCLQDVEGLKKKCLDLGLKMDSVPHQPEAVQKQRKKRPAICGEYEVEAIMDYVVDKNDSWYLIKWKGWDHRFNTWEPRRNLVNCQKLLYEFHGKRIIKTFDNDRKKLKTLEEERQQKDRESLIRDLVRKICHPDMEDFATVLKLLGTTPSAFMKSGCSKNRAKDELRRHVEEQLRRRNRGGHGVSIVHILDAEEVFENDAALLDFVFQRQFVLQKLKLWESELNRVIGHVCPITVENHVDLEGPPENFTLITDYKAGDGIVIPNDPLVGCECEDCRENQKHCCATQSGCMFAYNKYGYLKVPERSPIYECNKRCKCGPDCINRIVQKGRQVKVAVFRTDDGRGWGVRTLDKIKRGAFVMEYVGEVITNDEAEKRGWIYDSVGRTYLFDLDYNEGDCPYTVDAASYGNVAHFMNHSCDPNLSVFSVWIDNLDPRLPRIAFFAKKDIKRGEELTFDYQMRVSGTSDGTPRSPKSPMISRGASSPPSPQPTDLVTGAVAEAPIKGPIRTVCKCGAPKCRKFLF